MLPESVNVPAVPPVPILANAACAAVMVTLWPAVTSITSPVANPVNALKLSPVPTPSVTNESVCNLADKVAYCAAFKEIEPVMPLSASLATLVTRTAMAAASMLVATTVAFATASSLLNKAVNFVEF